MNLLAGGAPVRLVHVLSQNTSRSQATFFKEVLNDWLPEPWVIFVLTLFPISLQGAVQDSGVGQSFGFVPVQRKTVMW